MILNEFDAYQEALKKINLNEEVMPIYNGRLLIENVDMYCKIQKLLGCNAFEGAHRWLYDLDIENLDESECSKVCNLYQLGIDRGYIDDDTVAEDPNAEANLSATPSSSAQDAQVISDPEAEAPESKIPVEQSVPMAAAYTVIYSATRDGQIKTGEAYSNSLNTRSAKADIISKLEKAGYQNISILAIEAGDPDVAGCDNTFCKQSDYVPPAYEDEEDKLEEADDREPLSHAFDEAGVKASTANSVGQDAVEMSIKEKDEDADSSDEEKSDDDAADDAEDDADDSSNDDSSDDSEDKKADKKEEDAEEPDEKLKADKKEEDGKEDATDDKEEKELSTQEKTQLKDSYKKAFKAAMQKCKYFDKSFDDLTLEEKVKFFETIDEAWGDKADPTKFMTDKETEQLEKIVVKK